MRTKTLLLTAVLGLASAATSMAQVYSANVVGYVNQSYPAGYSIINAPLKGTNNAVPFLFASPPDFSIIYKFTGGLYEPANAYMFGSWSDPAQVLDPGDGAFLYSPSAWTNTYVGEVLLGAQTNTLPVGFSLKGSKVPQAGGLEALLGLVPGDFDIVYKFNQGTQNYDPANAYMFGSWANGDPAINVAEGFFYFNAQGAANNWTRTFNP